VFGNRYKAALFVTVAMNSVLTGQAFAQADDAIIVTARRVEERLQDVPISMSVVDQERLAKANIVNATDLAKVVPGLSVQSRYSPEMSTFSIRGFSQELRTSASVGTYFADVVSPRGGGGSLQGGDGAGAAYLFDLQNVQVLKGPQGTLFGRNTTGGAVVLVPRKPTSRFEGYVEGSLGNYDMKRMQAVVNIPISSDARLRLGVDRMTRDGYLHNVSGIGPSRFSDVDFLALRASFVADLASNLESYTIGTFFESDHAPVAPQLIRGNPAIPVFGPAAVAQVNRLNASGDPYQVEQKLANPRSWTQQWQLINTMTWRASDDLTIKNIASYSEFRQILRSDVFGTNFQFTPPGGTVPTGYYSTSFSFNSNNAYTNDQRNFTEELQFQGMAADGKLNWQAGLYYESSTPGSFIGSAAPSSGSVCAFGAFEVTEDLRCLGGGTVSNPLGKIKYINMGAYAQGTYAVTDQLKLTAGVRYTYDRTRGISIARRWTFVPTTNPLAFVPPSPPTCSPLYPAPDCRIDSATSSKKPTWTLNIAYNPLDDVMLYATYSRGYRQGAASPFSSATAQTFDPETVDSYELGAKTSFRGDVSGRFNIAGFYTKLKNQQLQYGLLSTSGNGSATSIFNAGRSRMYGFEMDSSLNFFDFFRLDGSAVYLNSKLQSATTPPPIPGYEVVLPSAVVGDELAYSPKWTANLSGTIMLPVSESLGKVELGATYRYQSSFATAASSASPMGTSLRASQVSQLDLNFDWKDIAGYPVDLSLFATNVTKQKTYVLITPLFGSFGFDVANLGEPRMYGLRLKVRFGEGLWD
jgi:iron complex outermembrane receptor protein